MTKLRGIKRYGLTNRRIALNFSPRSLALRRGEYTEVYDSLRASVNHPAAKAEDISVVRQLLREHERTPSLGNLSLIMYIQEWPSVSRALRRWQHDDQPRAYTVAARAFGRKSWL